MTRKLLNFYFVASIMPWWKRRCRGEMDPGFHRDDVQLPPRYEENTGP